MLESRQKYNHGCHFLFSISFNKHHMSERRQKIQKMLPFLFTWILQRTVHVWKKVKTHTNCCHCSINFTERLSFERNRKDTKTVPVFFFRNFLWTAYIWKICVRTQKLFPLLCSKISTELLIFGMLPVIFLLFLH